MEAGGRHKHDPKFPKSAFGPSKTGVLDTKNHDYGAVDVPKMPQLRSSGSKGLWVLRGREFHNGMGPKSTFRGISARTGTRAARREPGMISSAPTTTTTVRTGEEEDITSMLCPLSILHPIIYLPSFPQAIKGAKNRETTGFKREHPSYVLPKTGHPLYVLSPQEVRLSRSRAASAPQCM